RRFVIPREPSDREAYSAIHVTPPRRAKVGPSVAALPRDDSISTELHHVRYVGLLGGMSWESTAEYYRLINRGVAERLGGLHSAPLVMHSVDFAEIAALQRAGDWARAGELLAAAALGLERAGAEAIVLCTNTMHNVAAAIESALSVPLLHIVDATG